jgi:hypothetical protein
LTLATITGNLHGRIALAKIYDAAGDTERACRAYASLVALLGRTSSVSAAHARKRRVELSCPPSL